jgi:Tol biopolymer transport system component
MKRGPALTRRQWLALTAASVTAQFRPFCAAYAGAQTHSGQLLLHAISKGNANKELKLHGLGFLEVTHGGWTQPIDPNITFARVSPNGRLLAYVAPSWKRAARYSSTWVRDASGQEDPKCIFDDARPVCWSSDGRRLLVVRTGQNPAVQEIQSWLVNIDDGSAEKLPLSRHAYVHDWSPDGRHVVAGWGGDQGFRGSLSSYWPIEVMDVHGEARRRLFEGSIPEGIGYSQSRFTPDGRKVLCIKTEQPSQIVSLWAFDLERNRLENIIPAREIESVNSYCISPDGKSIAVYFTSYDRDARGNAVATFGHELAILDIDGGNRRSLPVSCDFLSLFDWRADAR